MEKSLLPSFSCFTHQQWHCKRHFFLEPVPAIMKQSKPRRMASVTLMLDIWFQSFESFLESCNKVLMNHFRRMIPRMIPCSLKHTIVISEVDGMDWLDDVSTCSSHRVHCLVAHLRSCARDLHQHDQNTPDLCIFFTSIFWSLTYIQRGWNQD